MTREQRQAIGRALKALPLRVVGTRPIEEAIVTRGGVDVLEITPGTMMSKNVPGLFFAGEVLDVDAHTVDLICKSLFQPERWQGKSCCLELGKLKRHYKGRPRPSFSFLSVLSGWIQLSFRIQC